MRRYAFQRLTFRVVKNGWVTPLLLHVVLSSWVSVFMYRRPLFSLFVESFAHVGTDDKTVYPLPASVRDELLMAALVAPLAYTDTRVPYADQGECVDASPYGGGICSTLLPEGWATEAYRLRELRGYYHLAPAVDLELGETPGVLEAPGKVACI